MDIRTKLILALVATSLLSMFVFAVMVYQFSASLVLASAGPEAADELFSRVIDTGLSVAAFAILAGVILGILMARQIRRLAETVDRIRHGELALRADVVGEDEVALLARSLNEFMDQLNRSSDIFQLGELRVLVVEDNLPSRHLLEELLTNWRMHALMVNNENSATQAIAAAERQSEPIQLVVIDADMPAMQDRTLLAELVKLKAQHACPIIVLATDPKSLDQNTLHDMGIQHVLPAPLVASDLMQAILEEMGVSAQAMENIPDVLLTPTEPRSILLAEDSHIIQKVTVGFLKNWGHNVTIAVDGQAALDAVQRKQFDLVLMDLEMPVMGGLEATRRIRANESGSGNRLPIVALTAKATKADREECMAVGMDEYVAKPVDPKVLYRLINSFPCRAAGLDNQDAASNGDSQATLIDWEHARKLTGDDNELLKELVNLFPAQSDKYLDEIAAAIVAKDQAAITRSAHTLKGEARFFGAKELVDCALNIENSGRSGALDGLDEQLLCLRKLTQQLVCEMQADASNHVN